jgi:peptidoglycan/xylan/chitin deacetylase (PgdA/CDA1 family)
LYYICDVIFARIVAKRLIYFGRKYFKCVSEGPLSILSVLAQFLVMIWFSLLILLVFVAFFLRPRQGVRVLMYHKVVTQKTDFLSVTTAQLEAQLAYLKSENYQFITAQNLLDFYVDNKSLPPNPILLTFDDGYVNNLELAYPILKKHRSKATIFVPTFFVGKTNEWDNGEDKIMSLEQLRNLDPSVFELALHSHKHQNYAELSVGEIAEDVAQNVAFFKENKLNYTPVFAYPYGGRPENDVKNKMVSVFKMMGVKAAFRIGNRVNSLKIKELYELNRIDVRGTDSFWLFKWKVRVGKIW